MKRTYLKELLYAILMIIFFTISYIFLNTGFNTFTKISINYQEKSTSHYEIKFLENDIYDLTLKNNDWNLLSNLIDDINIHYDYKVTFSDYAIGYYKYKVTIKEIYFSNDDIISEKAITEGEEKTSLLDKEKIILINDYININYDNYKKEFITTKEKYGINPSSKLLVEINIYENVSFNKKEDNELTNKISFEIPLSDEIIRIKSNNIDSNNRINELSKKEDINYFLILVGLMFLSLGITFLVSVVLIIKNIYNREKTYKEKLKQILTKHDNVIINVKKIVNIKKYNLIYVENFKELLDVYKQYKN